MWLYLSLASAFLLGFYDIFKKRSLQKNSVMWVLVSVTAISTIILAPFFKADAAEGSLLLIPKGILVATSWISGLMAMKLLPLTTISTIKASRPVFVLIFSILLFGEKLNAWQWVGVFTVFTALWMLSRSSEKEGISFKSNKGILWIAVSVFSGVASALYDKFVITKMDPMSVLCWSNLYILVILCIVLGVKTLIDRHSTSLHTEEAIVKGTSEAAPEDVTGRFRWDWNLLFTAIIIVGADALYFQSLAQEGAMLSIISIIRRCSVVVTFAGSAILFKENNIKSKAIDLAVLMAGVAVLASLS